MSIIKETIPVPSVKALGVYGPHIDIPNVTKESLLGPELYEEFAAECRSLVASGKGDEIKLLPFRGRKSDHYFRQTFLSYRDIETSKAAVEKMIANIKVPLLIVYDRADNIQGKGTITRRETIATRIKESAVNALERISS